MAIKVPIRTVYDNSNNAVGLSEFQSSEAVGYQHGGTGLTTLGSAGQILKVNDAGTAVEWAADAQRDLTGYLQVANAQVSYVTKSVALSSNNAQNSLILDRLQVANAIATYSTLAQLGNTNTYIANKAISTVAFTSGNNTLKITTGDSTEYDATIDVSDKATWTALLSTNTALRTLINTQIGSSNTSIRQYINSEIGSSNTNIRNYTNQTFETKAVALSSNNALNNLINDRLQVANVAAIYATKAYAAANTYVNAQIGASNTNIRSYTDQTFETKAVALSSNNAQNSLILDRMQVANVTSLVSTEIANLVDSSPEALNTLNELAAALGDDANFSTTILTSLGTKAANTYVNQTFETKSVALSSNNAQNSLILDRLQVANAVATYAPLAGATFTGAVAGTKLSLTGPITAPSITANTATLGGLSYPTSDGTNGQALLTNGAGTLALGTPVVRNSLSTITANTTLDTSNHNIALVVNSSANVFVTIDASGNLTQGDKFTILPVSTGNIVVKLDGADSFLGTSTDSIQISVFANDTIASQQNNQIDEAASGEVITTGLYTKIEVLYIGSGNFVLTK